MEWIRSRRGEATRWREEREGGEGGEGREEDTRGKGEEKIEEGTRAEAQRRGGGEERRGREAGTRKGILLNRIYRMDGIGTRIV